MPASAAECFLKVSYEVTHILVTLKCLNCSTLCASWCCCISTNTCVGVRTWEVVPIIQSMIWKNSMVHLSEEVGNSSLD